ncbi:hypothetical protein [Burkholderia ubonensis]|uniref:InvB/SpaK family type III secretion system chaperone n=1 Tax=Burkholderia ubonensis TaxID=101571 RepID=UPI000752ED0A|nr:hypothetical protein [Burkholderia ubonensis]KVN41164.1 hypothetical protein WJ64_32705 [Burkholderia ubonensis]
MLVADLGKLVREALVACGCDASEIAPLDNHGTIVVDLRELPALHIGRDGDDIWLWAYLSSRPDLLIRQHTAELLEIVMQDVAYSRTRQLQLAESDGRMELRCLVHPDNVLDASRFSTALDGFFSRLQAAYERGLR